MTEVRDARWKLLLAFAIVYIVWGSTYLAIRYAVQTIPPLLMAGSRFLVAGTLLFAVSLLRTSVRPKLIHWRTAVVLGFLLLFCSNGAVTVAEQRITSGMAALLITSEPMWIVLLNWLRVGGRAPSTREIAGVVIGFAGVALLLSPQMSALHGSLAGSNLFWYLLIVLTALTWAAGSLYGIGAPMVADRPMGNGMTMLVGGGMMFFSGLATGEARGFQWHAVSAISIAAWAYLIVFGSLAAFSAYTYLMSNATPAKASTYAFVNPVVAVLLGWSVAGEPLDVRSALAIAIIVGAVMMLTLGQPPRRPESTEREEPEPEIVPDTI
jgi:drug/metabolite transporter (DMT)-like permease